MPKSSTKRPLAAPQTARATVRAGKFVMKAEVRTTPLGLLAAGGLIASILLSVVPIVRASRRRARALPGIAAERLDHQPPLRLLPSTMPSLDTD